MSKRPYVICHVFAGLNGHIDGAYMFDPAAAAPRAAYAQLQGSFGADSIAYGAVTTKGFEGADAPEIDATADVPAGDYVAPHRENKFYISIDPAGEIAWRSATYRRTGHDDAHVIEVLTASTPRGYRAYLRDRGISYVLAGKDALNLPLALEKLRLLFGIERTLVCGGGKTDMSFLAAGVLDELSLVLSPTVSGKSGVASVFDEMPGAAVRSHAFELKRMERVGGSGLHLVYKVLR